jgi:hypothetical protein
MSGKAWRDDMTTDQELEFRKALHAAFVEAIQKVGLATFKATSMFKSNESRVQKQAA